VISRDASAHRVARAIVAPHGSLLTAVIQERFVDKLRTLYAVFWTLIGVLVLYAILAAFLYQFGVEQYGTSIRR